MQAKGSGGRRGPRDALPWELPRPPDCGAAVVLLGMHKAEVTEESIVVRRARTSDPWRWSDCSRTGCSERGACDAGLKSANNKNYSHSGMVDCLSNIYQQGGMRGLFRGAGARVIHFTPATMITMTCFEKCRSFFQTNIF